MHPGSPWTSSLNTLTILLLLSTTCHASDRIPAPIAVPPSNDFLGDDGQWSPVNIQVGSDSQSLSLLPNTGSSETWVIGLGGCDATFTCQQERGGIFAADESTTWVNLGDYELDFDTDLGDSGYADYGLDTVAVSGSASIDAQIVGILNTTEFWLGQFGLGVHSTGFNGATNRLSFLSGLVENASLIPSHSYGYTAGAYYRLKSVPASLTLGGVDSNRFVPNAAIYELGPQLQLILAINEISVKAQPSQTSNAPPWSSNPLLLLDNSQANLFTIDSSTPFLWLPPSVCDNFAEAFGLIYNETLDLYLFNESSSPNILNSWNMEFTISISDMPGSTSNRVDITLPYAAFDLQLKYPYPNLDANFSSPATNYFPLRRASNNNQYTIGRAFLQEAYLTVDYERGNFSISQARFSMDALTDINLVPITRPPNSNWTGPVEPESSGLSIGAEAGAAVAAGAIVVAVVALCLYFVFKRRRNAVPNAQRSAKNTSCITTKTTESLFELPSSTVTIAFNELPASRHFPFEADSRAAPTELPDSALPIEMPAEAVPTSFLSSSSSSNNNTLASRWRHRYAIPASVQHARSASTQKAPLDVEPSVALHHHAPSGDNLPPYSPVNSEDMISPNSAHPSNRSGGLGTNTHSSGDRQVSPLDGPGRYGSLPHSRNALHPSHSTNVEDNTNSHSPISPLDPVARGGGGGSRNFSRPVDQGQAVVLMRRLDRDAGGGRPSQPERFSWENNDHSTQI